MPGRVGPDRDALGERVAGDEEGEAEHDEQHLGQQVEHGDEDPVAVEGRAADEPDRGDAEHDADADDDVPGVVLERAPLQRRAEVVRQEERRERDHDQVVEEERPAGEEAGQVVEGAADEGGGAARLRNRGRALRVRERDDQEERADDGEHLGRQAERVQGDDPERDVDRGGDLAVGDREERRRVENALQPRDLPRHGRRLLRSSDSHCDCHRRQSRYSRPAPRPTNRTPIR